MFNRTRTPKWLLIVNKTVTVLATLTVIFNMSALGVFLAPRAADAANPSANLDQCRNGSAASPNNCLSLGGGTGWVNGNAGATQAHYVEGMSIPYRAILEDLPTGSPITITFGYDIKHSDAHAIDFLTSYNRLSPHTDFGHAAETVNPVSGVAGIVGGANTFAIPAPSSVGSPAAGQPTTVFNSLPANEKLMSIWNGSISNIDYLSQGDLTANQAETQINITFTPTQSKVVLSWGGHIGSRLDWGLGNSAGGISGSPYHMRLIGWSIGNLGQQDRSLSAAAVVPAPIPGIEKTAAPVGATNRDTEILYTITYGNSGNAQTTVNLTDTWSFGSDVVATYVAGSATNAYGGIAPVVNTGTKTITWSNVIIPAYTIGLTVSYRLKTNATNANAGTFHIYNEAKLVEGTKILTTTKTDNWVNYACVLGITKSVNATNAKPGDTLTYTLNYQNTGTANCTGGGVRVDDVIPVGTTYTGTHTQTAGTDYGYGFAKFGVISDGYDEATKLLSWNAHELTPGESGTVTYNVTVNAITYCSESDIPNTAKIYSDQFPNGITSNQVSTHIVADCLGKLKVTKVVDKGDLTADNWSFTVGNATLTPAQGTDYVEFTLPAGTYTATESSVAGYHQVSNTCQNVLVTPNQTATCEFHNAQDIGQLTVIKHVVGSNEPASSWTMNVAGNTPLSFPGSEAGTTNEVIAGDYTITESAMQGYTLSYSGDCDLQGNVKIEHGDEKTCTLINTRDTGRIIVYKNVDTDGDGDIDVTGATNWTWDVASGAQNIATGTGTGVDTGNYTISEDQKANYHVTDLTCDNQSYRAVESGLVTVAKDQVVECTFTNTRDTGDLRIKKYEDMNGNGSKDANEPYLIGWDFTVSQNGQTVTSGTTNVNDSNYLYINNLPTGTYDVTETLETGWINTEPGTVPATKQVTINKDQLTSVWFGNFELGKISGYKWNDVNGDGQFTDGVDYVLPNWFICLDGSNCVQTDQSGYYEFTNLQAGTYNVAETIVPGWTATSPFSTNVEILSGSDVRVDFFNFQYGKISGYKWNDLNGNGTWEQNEPGLANWTISLWKNAQFYGNQITDQNGYYEFDQLQAGSYAVSEDESNPLWVRTSQPATHGPLDLQSGSQFTDKNFGNFKTPTLTVIKHVVNDDGGNAVASDFTMNVTGTNVSDPSFPGDENGTTVSLWAGSYSVDEIEIDGYEKSIGVNCQGTVQSGDEITCTITNDDEAPTITLNKQVINNNGGNASENDFGLTIGGTQVTSGQTLVVDANTPYALDEAGLSGYSFVSLTGDEVCPVILNGTVTLNEGEEITCTITNDDVAPTITLVKNVINNNGGNAQPNDFNLTIGGSAALSGVTYPVLANTPYALDETQLSGYEFISLAGEGCTTELGETVTLNEGENVTCAITNDDVAPTITLIKDVQNDNGGNAQPNDFNLTIGGIAVESGVTYNVNANTAYGLNETQLSGYTFVEIKGDRICPLVLGGEVTLDEGEDITCTIVNNDIAPTITLVKNVINDNGGNATENDFGLTIGGDAATSGTTYDVDANTPYALDEAGLSGYTFVSLSGDEDCPAVLGGEVTLDEGEDITCTITNDDVAPTITLIKVLDEELNNGGDADVNSFGLTIGANPAVSGTTYNVDANTPYALNEAGLSGYTFVSLTGEGCPTELGGTVTLNEGQNVTCTITNDDVPGRVVGYKYEDVNHSGTWDEGEDGLADWTFYLRTESAEGPIAYTTTSDSNGFFEFNNVDMGAYFLTEELKLKWDQITPVSGYFEVVIVPGYDNSDFCESDVSSLNSTEINSQFEVPCGFLFGNAEQVTLHVDKQADKDVVQAEETINYRIDWSISGNSIAVNVVLTDTIPTELVIDTATISDGGVYDSNTRVITWDFGTQQPNASGFVTYQAKTIVPIANGTEIHNVARLSADNSDPLFDEDDDTVRVVSNPILGTEKTVDIHNNFGFVNPEATVTYTVVVTNTGTDTAYNVTLTDTLPDGFLFADTLTPSKVFNLGGIAVGGSVTTTYDVIVGKNVLAGTYDNLAVARADNHDPVDDTVPVVVKVPVPEGEETEPELVITKKADVSTANPGGTVNYTIEVKNIGDGAAINVMLTDTLPTGFTYEDGTTTKTWALGTIAPGLSQIVTYKVKVATNATAGTKENVAVAKADNHNSVEARAQVQVKVPQVLGATTGASMGDLMIFLSSMLIIFTGFMFIRQGRRQTQSA